MTAPTTAAAVSEADIRDAVDRITTEILFPGECDHTPDTFDLIRAGKYGGMLKQRMRELVSIGVDPTRMTAEELLPGVKPQDIEVTEDDV